MPVRTSVHGPSAYSTYILTYISPPICVLVGLREWMCSVGEWMCSVGGWMCSVGGWMCSVGE